MIKESDPLSSPLARFGEELRRSRKARGWSQVYLGELMGYSDTLISFIERVKRPPTPEFAVKADEVFETGGTFYELWRRIDKARLLEGLSEFVEAEKKCRRLRAFSLTVITGLLQTGEYAGALASAAVLRGVITRAQADERLAFLASRQKLLDEKKPPTIHAVLDEGCLVRTLGGMGLMSRQLMHLEVLAERPNVTIQVAPFQVGEHLPFVHPVILLDMPDRSTLGYAESYARGHLERAQQTVAVWDSEYDQLQMEALPKAASLEFIRKLRRELS